MPVQPSPPRLQGSSFLWGSHASADPPVSNPTFSGAPGSTAAAALTSEPPQKASAAAQQPHTASLGFLSGPLDNQAWAFGPSTANGKQLSEAASNFLDAQSDSTFAQQLLALQSALGHDKAPGQQAPVHPINQLQQAPGQQLTQQRAASPARPKLPPGFTTAQYTAAQQPSRAATPPSAHGSMDGLTYQHDSAMTHRSEARPNSAPLPQQGGAPHSNSLDAPALRGANAPHLQPHSQGMRRHNVPDRLAHAMRRKTQLLSCVVIRAVPEHCRIIIA